MKKKQLNRLQHTQPDYLLLIVRKPDDWTPNGYADVPPTGTVESVFHVASFQEAEDDRLRCNRLAAQRGLKQWAVVHSPGTDL